MILNWNVEGWNFTLILVVDGLWLCFVLVTTTSSLLYGSSNNFKMFCLCWGIFTTSVKGKVIINLLRSSMTLYIIWVELDARFFLLVPFPSATFWFDTFSFIFYFSFSFFSLVKVAFILGSIYKSSLLGDVYLWVGIVVSLYKYIHGYLISIHLHSFGSFIV